MPRRNRNPRARRRRAPSLPIEAEWQPTYEQLARELVKAGRCSRLILEHPMRTTTEGLTR